MLTAWFIGLGVLVLLVFGLLLIYFWPLIILLIIIIIIMLSAPKPMQKQYIIKTTSDTTHTIGRNDPCPCGSGKKYKNCCGAKKEAKDSLIQQF